MNQGNTFGMTFMTINELREFFYITVDWRNNEGFQWQNGPFGNEIG